MYCLDLRNIRCPLALVLLKQTLIKTEHSADIKILFSNQAAMQDLRLYLDKKNYCYSCDQTTLLVKLSD